MFGLMIPSSAKIVLAGALAVSLASAAAYIKGRMDGREIGRVAALEQAVEAYKNRQEIDHETGNLADRDLCLALGGLPDECEVVLRGLDEATEDQ